MLFMYNGHAGVVGACKYPLEETGLMASLMRHEGFFGPHVSPGP